MKNQNKINQTGNSNVNHANQNPQKNQTERKVEECLKNGQTTSETGRYIQEIEMLSLIFYHRRHSENFVKLLRKNEESIRYIFDPEGSLVNLIKDFFLGKRI